MTAGEYEEKLRANIRAAVGMSQERGDEVLISSVPFQELDLAESSSFLPIPTSTLISMGMGALPYLLGLVALVLSFTYVVRPLMARITESKPPLTLEEQLAELEKQAEGDEHLTVRLRKLIDNFRPIDSAELSGLVAQQPSAAAKVLKQWKRFG